MVGYGRNKNLNGDIDIGLAVMENLATRGVPLTQKVMAQVCNCSQARIYLIEIDARKHLRDELRNYYRTIFEEELCIR